MAPIDPDQLLKALENLLSETGGIKSTEDVPRLVSLMKKFSKKLVSRCVYCNVLQATDASILSEYLDKGGWETINTWLQYAKSSSSPSFLLEMLKLCKILPMTVGRLKENNTAKLIKGLTKHENDDVKDLSTDLVTKWMTIIKSQKVEAPVVEKKKKKEKSKHDHEKKENKTSPKRSPTSPKSPARLKGTKRSSSDKEPAKETTKHEEYEDVKIDPEPLMPMVKKLRPDRPKTAKVYQKKFRSTGLEEETPLPKNLPKKTATVDKSFAVAAAKNALKVSAVLPERVTEKKLKPETLATINENSPTSKGIKLINPKPRPTYMLHDSASFMDALTSQPVAPTIKRKKKPVNKPATQPTSPTITAPKLQFYKDTLEMNESPKKEESEKENISSDIKDEDSPKKEDQPVPESQIEEEKPMEVDEEIAGGNTPPISEVEKSRPSGDAEDFDGVEDDTPFDPSHLRSILSIGRRKGKKKSVRWVEDEFMKETFYFEMDETERVNVNKAQNFCDLQTIELKKEREAIEMAKRQAGDNMEERTRWWMKPIVIDLPAQLIEPGYLSTEKEVERLRQQSTLQEIYFTREMIPDSPHEPDLEIVASQEPKEIPTDEENTIGALVDYSSYVIPKPVPAVLPDVLSTLMKMQSNLPLPQLNNNDQFNMDMTPNLPHMSPDGMNQPNFGLNTPYDPAEPVNNMPPSALMGVPPLHQQQQQAPPNMYGMNSPPMSEPPHPMMGGPPHQNEWRTLEMVQDQYQFGNFPPMGNNMMPPHGGNNLNMRPRMMGDNFRPHKGPPRAMGPRGPRGLLHRVPCRHFMAGACRFAMNCTFLHPGINGPRM